MPEVLRPGGPHGGHRGLVLAALAGLALCALALPIAFRLAPLVVWNASASSPIGLYVIAPGNDLRRGQMALAWPPPAARALGAARRYLPRNVPLVKRVGAARGDWVCASGDAVFVNARLAARRLRTDPAGRPMPWWHGCERLREGDVLLLSAAAPLAFDGRYFGVSRAGDVVGRARLVWHR